MGRIKTKLIKRTTLELVEKHGDKFAPEFDKNKKLVEQYVEFPSKKMRNLVSGYVTRIIRKRQESA